MVFKRPFCKAWHGEMWLDLTRILAWEPKPHAIPPEPKLTGEMKRDVEKRSAWIPCKTSEGSSAALETVSELARSAGMPLKPEVDAISAVGAGDSVTWLGYHLQREGSRLSIRISDRAWNSLECKLALAHLVPASPLRAADIVRGWLDQMGPCYPFERSGGAIERIYGIAAEQGFDELPPQQELVCRFQLAHGRWTRLYRRRASLLLSRLAMSQTNTTPRNCSSHCATAPEAPPYHEGI